MKSKKRKMHENAYCKIQSIVVHRKNLSDNLIIVFPVNIFEKLFSKTPKIDFLEKCTKKR